MLRGLFLLKALRPDTKLQRADTKVPPVWAHLLEPAVLVTHQLNYVTFSGLIVTFIYSITELHTFTFKASVIR